MALYAISDPHLASAEDKPMDIFGVKWVDHVEKIKENWMEVVKEEDTVLVAGDISWSMNMESGREDLEFINNLPGRKIFVRGNHDYWWSSIKKLNAMFSGMEFIQNNFFVYEDYAICGSRGWILENSPKFNTHDRKIYDREILRLKLSLDEAVKQGYEKIICMIHYPPIFPNMQDSEFTKVFQEYNVEKVIYGHLHGGGLSNVFEGEKDGVEYILTSCDYINFRPIKILE
ncbi:metallophosphoesterase [Clostridium sp.]|uniref:metallophosphoesterase n=1 Tax=Clostridium sp. TaxID=1506 RepID=UPI0032169586